MARIEWVKQRLENWALWHERGRGGGLGFSKQSAFLRECVDGGRDEGARVPVDEVDASVTHQAVESLKLGSGHLYKTLQLIYLRGVGVKRAAVEMHRAESTIKAQLEQADAKLAAWFGERQRQQQAARTAYQQSATQTATHRSFTT